MGRGRKRKIILESDNIRNSLEKNKKDGSVHERNGKKMKVCNISNNNIFDNTSLKKIKKNNTKTSSVDDKINPLKNNISSKKNSPRKKSVMGKKKSIGNKKTMKTKEKKKNSTVKKR